MLVLELGHKERVEHLAFAPDGAALVGADNSRVALWSAFASGAQPKELAGVRWVSSLQFTADGRWLFLKTYNGLMRVDPATVESVACGWAHGAHGTFDLALSPTEPLGLVTEFGTGGPEPMRISLRRTDDLSPAGVIWARDFPGLGYWSAAQFLPGSNRFARFQTGWGTKGLSYQLAIHDIATGEALIAPVAIPHGGRISPDGRWLVSRNPNAINLFPLRPGDASGHVKNDNKKHFTAVAFHPNGKFLAATSNDTTVKLYDTTTWELARTFTWNIGKMRSIAFSPDGTLAAAGGDKGQVVVWDVDG